MATRSKSKSSKRGASGASKDLKVRRDQSGKIKGGQVKSGAVRGGPVLGSEDLA